MASWEENNSIDKSLRRFDISRSRNSATNFTATIRNPKTGQVEKIGPCNSSWSLEYAIEQYCRKNKYEAGSSWGGARKGAGRPRGSTAEMVARRREQEKFLAQRRGAYEKFLTKEFGKIKAAAIMVADAAAAGACAKISERVAKDVLRRVVNDQGKFNIYSGNLSNAYHALIIQGRRVVQVVKRDKKTAGNRFDPLNGIFVVRLKLRRHRTKNRWKKRYVKSYEREEGYEDISSFRKGVVNIGYMNALSETKMGKNNGRAQSGIIVENSAPYAGAVQARGYQVVPNAVMRGYQGRIGSAQQSVLYAMTKNMLHAAGLI